MIHINMFSSADKVAGQGVGSAYLELMRLLKKYGQQSFEVTVNQYGSADISHYHTIDPQFFLSTFIGHRGRKIGYVHFLPETLEGSLQLPRPIKAILDKYVIAFYKRMDQIVVVNPIFIDKLAAYGIPKSKIAYIPNFVSQDEFYAQSEHKKAQTRASLGIKADAFVVFGDGQVQKRKGVDDFVALAKRHPEMNFVWAGGFSFGKMTDGYEKYKKIIDNPPKNLTFTGIVERKSLVDFYNMADVFLLPSYDELFPMSVLEAFSCQTPVLLRDLPLYQAIISGYYASGSDLAGLDEQLVYLKENPEERQRLKLAAKAAATKFSEQNLAKIWQDFYLKQAHNQMSQLVEDLMKN
ncbi:glycosyltransferase family 4 protein [Agrilactobacillus fermenti]|uniref:glycosyltransferase family 4 protein n=1 Tax=Agrilactobacillus fermenti TaxID=2586909 RepID=UPI001E3FE595|nr:glycosyltransferase family 4 protein [Agrilactobacillus fermenti]MCD2257252.1 glycosyltransferase family 4 protein [Agrilactobacillus fermenti]